MGIRIGLRCAHLIHTHGGQRNMLGHLFGAREIWGLGNSEQSVLNKAVGSLSVRCDEVIVEV